MFEAPRRPLQVSAVTKYHSADWFRGGESGVRGGRKSGDS